jgi:hypothetical protein
VSFAGGVVCENAAAPKPIRIVKSKSFFMRYWVLCFEPNLQKPC